MYAPRPAPGAEIVFGGDDIYEDFSSAALGLRNIATTAGFAARVRMGTAAFALPRTQQPALVILYRATGTFHPAEQQALADLVASGTGLLAIHSSAFYNLEDGKVSERDRIVRDLIGCHFVDHGPRPHDSTFTVEIMPGHELTDGIEPFTLEHEHYRTATVDDITVHVRRRTAEGGYEPILYSRRHGAGRVAYLQLGHHGGVWAVPGVRDLLVRTMTWLASPAVEHAADRSA